MSSAQLKKFASVKPADIEWRDGLPYSREFEDVYYSDCGALEESEHVFLKGCQLESDWLDYQQDNFYLAELGFGSGLNFLNTAALWNKTRENSQALSNKRLHYVSIEKRPFSIDDFKLSCLSWSQFKDISAELIRQYPSTTYGRHQINFDSHNLTLTLAFMPVEEALNDLVIESESQQNKIQIDHWFLDGFAPTKNESMWGSKIMQYIANLSKIGTRLSTYSVAGSVKKPIKDAGFKINKQKGFGRKREMLTARLETKSAQIKSNYINIKHESPWFNQSLTEDVDRVAIIGGGIAGCATAFSLSQRGIKVDLFEAHSALAQEATGAAAGLFHPQLTSDMNINSQFNWSAYLYLLSFLAELSSQERQEVILNQGIDRFLKSPQIKKQLVDLSEKLYLENWVEELTKLKKNQRGIHFPHAAALDMPEFCKLMWQKIPDNNKQLFLNNPILKLAPSDRGWSLVTEKESYHYKQVVFCGGANSGLLKQLITSKTNRSRGQTCLLNKTQIGHLHLAEKLNHSVSEKAYIVPRANDDIHIGTTFEDFEDDELNKKSQNELLFNSAKLLKELDINFLSPQEVEQQPLKGTVGYRLHSMDRLPFIGGVSDQARLETDFYHLGQTKLNRESISTYNLPGLWLNTAYGSHGLLYSLLGSKHLTSLICNDISPINQAISQALSPARSIIKNLKT